ncbi:transposase [Streptomyces sp. WAC 00631]|nr:transposase [Streptomyces sp. WAC 00631]
MGVGRAVLASGRARPDPPDLRRQFNAVMWRFRAGCPWRDVPQEYGSMR